MAYPHKFLVPSSTVPDAASVHVLYAGNLADDDFLWIVECTIEEFQKLLNAPVSWVKALALHPDWVYAGTQKLAPAPVLLNHFAMRVKPREKDTGSDLITIQGISYTGILTVRTSHASAVAGVRNLLSYRQAQASILDDDDATPLDRDLAIDDFWANIAYDPNNAPSYKKVYAVTVDLTDSRYYGHFEVCLPGQYDTQEQLAQTAAFILATGSDPQGFTNMLNGLNQSTQYVTPSGVVTGAPITMQLQSTSIEIPPDILYTSIDDETTATCTFLDGPYTPPPNSPSGDGGTGTIESPVIKKYGSMPPAPNNPGDSTGPA